MMVNGVEPGERFIMQLLFSSSVMGAPPLCLLRYHMKAALYAFSLEQDPHAIVVTLFQEFNFTYWSSVWSKNRMDKFNKLCYLPEYVLLEQQPSNYCSTFVANLGPERDPEMACWWKFSDCLDLAGLWVDQDDCIPMAQKRFECRRPATRSHQHQQCNCLCFCCNRWSRWLCWQTEWCSVLQSSLWTWGLEWVF